MSPAKIVQNAYVVRDLEAACRHFRDLYGIGPFIGGVEAALEDHVYRGKTAPPVRVKAVFAQSGDLNVELVQVMTEGPSAFHDMFGAGEEGFHHIAQFADDYEATRDHYVAMSMPVASEFTVLDGVKVCYIDARPTLGHMIELYPENATIRQMYAQAKEAPAQWDGKSLILPWA